MCKGSKNRTSRSLTTPGLYGSYFIQDEGAYSQQCMQFSYI